VTKYLNEQFPDLWIGRGGQQDWPLRSPELTPRFPSKGLYKKMKYERKENREEELLCRIVDGARRVNDANVLCNVHITLNFTYP
jgi:hypothetical protein